jgi:hypothetical protein
MELFSYELLCPNNYESTYNYRVYKLSYRKRIFIKLCLIILFFAIIWGLK